MRGLYIAPAPIAEAQRLALLAATLYPNRVFVGAFAGLLLSRYAIPNRNGDQPTAMQAGQIAVWIECELTATVPALGRQ